MKKGLKLLAQLFTFKGKMSSFWTTVKPVLPGHSKGRQKMVFKTDYGFNVGPREHSAILSTFIKLPFVIKPFVLSIF